MRNDPRDQKLQLEKIRLLFFLFFSKKINLNYRRKQAIVGTLIEDGKPTNVEYEFKEVGGETQKLKVEEIASLISKAKSN